MFIKIKQQIINTNEVLYVKRSDDRIILDGRDGIFAKGILIYFKNTKNIFIEDIDLETVYNLLKE